MKNILKSLLILILFLFSFFYFLDKERLLNYIDNYIYDKYQIKIIYDKFYTNQLNLINTSNNHLFYKNIKIVNINKIIIKTNATELNIKLNKIETEFKNMLPNILRNTHEINIKYSIFNFNNINIYNKDINCNFNIFEKKLKCSKNTKEIKSFIRNII